MPVQFINYLKGMTTSERFGRAANRADSETSEEHNVEMISHLITRTSAMSSGKSDISSEVRRPS